MVALQYVKDNSAPRIRSAAPSDFAILNGAARSRTLSKQSRYRTRYKSYLGGGFARRGCLSDGKV
jgi:hypothetical protein